MGRALENWPNSPFPLRILFVSNYAGRTGAPIVLLEFQRWLKARGAAQFSTVFGAGGPLWPEFQQLGEVRPSPYFDGARLPWAMTLLRRIVGVRRWPEWSADRGIGRSAAAAADVIHANTAVTAREILWLSSLGRPLVWHLHELRQVIESAVGLPLFKRALGHCRRVVAVSDGVREMLRSEFRIEEDRLESVPEFIRLRDGTPAQLRRQRGEFRARHGIGENDFVVGGCGTLGWRKGTDLFVMIARELLKRTLDRAVRLVWIGGGDEGVRRQLSHDLRCAGIDDRCAFIGEEPLGPEAMAAFDVLAMTSREDPYPLVMLEAAAAGVPMVGFEGSGGPEEFGRSGGGLLVPYADVNRYALELSRLASDAELLRNLGRQAEGIVRRHHDLEVQAPRLLEILRRAIQ